MRCIECKGMRIGEGIPKVIVPVMPAGLEDALSSARKAVEAGADCIELRLDFCDEVRDPAKMAALCSSLSQVLPETLLLATFRSKEQGGQLTLPVDEYCALVSELIRSGGADMVDVEIGIGDDRVALLCEQAGKAGVVPVVSYHDFEGTPNEAFLLDLLARMERLGAGVCKFAVMARELADALCVMKATEAYARTSSVPLLTMAMGSHGGMTRLMGELFGSSMTFCSLGQASAPGQVPVAQARRMMQDIHDVSF